MTQMIMKLPKGHDWKPSIFLLLMGKSMKMEENMYDWIDLKQEKLS